MSNYITSNFSNLIFSCSVPSQWHMEHRVTDHCVVFVRQGKLLISDKGRTEEIPAGSCVFLKKDCSVRLVKASFAGKNYEGLNIRLPQNILEDYFQRHLKNNEFSQDFTGLSNCFMRLNRTLCLQGLLSSIILFVEEGQDPGQKMAELKVEELILDLLQTNIRFFPTLFDFYRDWNVDLKEFMEDHFTENLSLSEFASYSGRSLATFKRDFLKITELSPAKWLMTRRLDLAENLLKENKLSIKQISYSVGFKTPAHFSTAFKKRHEMTPSEYRASNTGCN